MKQTSLVDDVLIASTRSAVPVVGVVGSAATLTKSQMRFNKLVERLTLQRQELARWQAFGRPITSNWPITITPWPRTCGKLGSAWSVCWIA